MHFKKSKILSILDKIINPPLLPCSTHEGTNIRERTPNYVYKFDQELLYLPKARWAVVRCRFYTYRIRTNVIGFRVFRYIPLLDKDII